jgi:hypothetical protein
LVALRREALLPFRFEGARLRGERDVARPQNVVRILALWAGGEPSKRRDMLF